MDQKQEIFVKHFKFKRPILNYFRKAELQIPLPRTFKMQIYTSLRIIIQIRGAKFVMPGSSTLHVVERLIVLEYNGNMTLRRRGIIEGE